MLELRDAHAGYGRISVLRNFNYQLASGETLAVGGPNGAGKSTLLKSIAGVLPISTGMLFFEGQDIGPLSAQARAANGIVLCPEGRKIFASLTIEENLQIGATVLRGTSHGSRGEIALAIERVYTMFPVLKERRSRFGGALSGGQQQMLAIGRALMARPRLLLLDEPSLGLSPLIADEVYAALTELKRTGLSMIIVEEAAGRPLAVADRGAIMRRGEIVRSSAASELLAANDYASDYLGEAA